MFNLFKKKTETEKLQAKYKGIMEEAFMLSKVSRAKSDAKYAEAELVMEQIKQQEENNE